MKTTIKQFTLLILISLSTIGLAKDSQKIDANELLDSVRKDLKSLVADFVQYETNATGNQSEKSTGKVWLNEPNQFKWLYQKPAPQLIMANGKKVWIYDEDLEQVIVKIQKSSQNPIYVLLNKEQTENNYIVTTITKDKSDKSPIQWIKMLPKESSDEIKVVWLGIVKNKITVLKLQNQLDNIVVFEFNNIKRNPKLEKSFFTFTPPKGVDVINEANNFGEF